MFHLRKLFAQARQRAARRRSRADRVPSEARADDPLGTALEVLACRERARPGAAGPGVDAALHLLFISCNAEPTAALRRIAERHGWRFTLADSVATVSGALSSTPLARPPTVVVFDRELPLSDWRRELPRLAALPPVSCVLLATAVADEYLWQEVSRFGGDDLLPMPFTSEEVRRIVSFAAAWGGGLRGRVPKR